MCDTPNWRPQGARLITHAKCHAARSAQKKAGPVTSRRIRDGRLRERQLRRATHTNEGQREFLCDMVEHALGAYGDQADSGDAAADHWQTVRRVFLVGVAGTGKTFTIDLLANALVAITGKAGALAAFCPTGAAAGAARGRTIDAALGVRRSRATYVELEGALRSCKTKTRAPTVRCLTKST